MYDAHDFCYWQIRHRLILSFSPPAQPANFSCSEQMNEQITHPAKNLRAASPLQAAGFLPSSYKLSAFDRREGNICIKALFHFLGLCATGVNSELASYKRHIDNGDYNFDEISKYPEFRVLMEPVFSCCSNESIINVLEWMKRQKAFKIHRKELFSEMLRALAYASSNNTTIFEAAQKIRTVPGLQKKYPSFRMLSSRTVLSKGLEFDCVIIDLEKGMTVTDFYVALTRAKRQVILITDKQRITLEPPRL